MKVGKSVGPDEIPMEVWKIVGEKAITWLQRLFNKMARRCRESGERAGWYHYIKGKGMHKSVRIIEA